MLWSSLGVLSAVNYKFMRDFVLPGAHQCQLKLLRLVDHQVMIFVYRKGRSSSSKPAGVISRAGLCGAGAEAEREELDTRDSA